MAELDLNAEQPLDRLTDPQLVVLYRRGLEKAFVVLLERYRQELFHFLIRFLGNRAAAEDIFHETFLQIHLSIDTFDTSRTFKPWLFTIAANKARDYLRRNSRDRATAALSAPVDDQEDGRQFIDLMDADLPLPSDQSEQQEVRELVKQVVDSLPEHLKEILVLAYFNQQPYKDIARMLGIPLGTVKSRLHAAVGTFAQEWKRRYHSSDQAAPPADEPGA
jgi:RNA polymerase sigma-70 factor (ECF subfamily)